jgi:type I restriction enzyme R subunit
MSMMRNTDRSESGAYGEDASSQLPALLMLRRLGWTYLSPDEAVAMRGGRQSSVFLTAVLIEKLGELNRIDTKQGPVPFGREVIASAVRRLETPADEGLVATNEAVWDMLRLGISIDVTVDGRKRGVPFRFIDWDDIGRNAFHVTEEFSVDRRGGGQERTRRPDIVCFVNGIPFIVIECKSAAIRDGKDPLAEAISQQLRNQRADEIPQLFHYAQLLVAASVNQAKYGATGTDAAYWASWHEQDFSEESLAQLVAAMPETEIEEARKLLGAAEHRQRPAAAAEAERVFDSLCRDRLPTPQDRLLQSVCSPARLLELARSFTLFEEGQRKVARYQQYACVKKCLRKFEAIAQDGRREGGIVWHTQGSGKSLTMCMLASQVMAVYAPLSPRVVVVTDRVDLDEQIADTFRRVLGEESVVRASSGGELEKLLVNPRTCVITTTIHKFDAFARRIASGKGRPIDDPNVFVFVDEGHRTQTGSLHAAMRRVLPRSCLVGFTGTPILRGEKQTAVAFGGIIDSYTIRQAVADRAVVNLVYEGRYSRQRVNSEPIDAWLAHHTHTLNDDQIQKLKERYASLSALNETEQRIREQAFDIATHFKTCFQGTTPFKAQLVAPSKAAAIRYKQCIDASGLGVTCEVLISPPDTREGNTAVDQADIDLVQRFWKERVDEYGSEERYRKEMIRRFKHEATPEIIIVVDMLLTGFDAPRNACLYLTRRLDGHNLLQAIARVNRVYTGKDHGLILDYWGVVKALGEAVDLYSTFDGQYDREDLDDVLTDIRQAIHDLPGAHAAVWDCFKGVAHDREAQERALHDEDARKQFYDRLSGFARCLKLALGSESFWNDTPAERVERYRRDLKYLLELRRSVAIRYAETVDFGQYEGAIRKLLDQYVDAEAPETLIQPTTIFDEQRLLAELTEFESPDAKAEVIANRLRRTIHEKMDEDPAFFQSLSDLLKAALDRYHKQRMDGSQLLAEVEGLADKVRGRERVDDQTVYQGIVESAANGQLTGVAKEAVVALAEAIERTVTQRAIVDWQDDPDVQNRMKTDIEDAIFEWQKAHGVDLGFDAIDRILDQSVDTARARSRR